MFATYKDTDLVVGDTSWLQAILSQARTGTRRILCFGDSRITSPNGSGATFYRYLARASYARYGNVPETHLQQIAYATPYFCGSGHNVEGQGSASGIAANKIPPNWFTWRPGTAGLGGVAAFHFDDHTLAGNATMSNYMGFDVDNLTTQKINCRIFGMTEPGAGELSAYFVHYNDLSYYGPGVGTFPTSMGLDAPYGTIKNQIIQPTFSYPDPTFHSMTFWPKGDSICLGCRWENPRNSAGLGFQPVANGGYTATTFQVHDAMGPFLNMVEPHAGMILLGANDIGNGSSAIQFKIDVLALISMLRTTMGKPTFPFILCADVYRQGLSSGLQAEHDQIAGVMAEIAQADGNAVAFNLGKVTRAGGANPDNGTWTGDGIHWTEYGSELIATCFTDLLFGLPPTPLPRPNYIPLQDNYGGFNNLLALESGSPMLTGRVVIQTEADYQVGNPVAKGSVEVRKGRWRGNIQVPNNEQYRILFIGSDGIVKSSKTITL